MTERPIPPTVRERLAFEAAIQGSPKDFVHACREARIKPETMLDNLDAEPWRWIFSFSPSDLVTDDMRRQAFPSDVRRKLDNTRTYVKTPPWRRLFDRRS